MLHPWSVHARWVVGAPAVQGVPEPTFLFWKPEIQLLQLFSLCFGVDAGGADCTATQLLLDISVEAQCQPLADYKSAGEILSIIFTDTGCAAEIMGLHICQTD